MLWQIFLQFIFRLSFGLATTMALTSPRQVSSGFYRIHLWVLLGLGTFGSLVAYSRQSFYANPTLLIGLAITGTLLSYVGSVIWLYEKVLPGMVVLVAVAATCLLVLLVSHPSSQLLSSTDWCWIVLDHITASLLLGSTFAAMLLGHWYLNSPTMKLDPLRWLLVILAGALAARAALCGVGLIVHLRQGHLADNFSLAAIALRWLAGLIGLAGMAWMTWQTLKIPNTQSATGILYVALVLVFLGELASALLSIQNPIPF